MTVTVYTTPSCAQCEITKRKLTRSQIPYVAIDLSTNPNAMEMIREQGFTQAPVVFAGDDSWSGFRPDKITALAEQVSAQPALAAA